MSDIPIGGGNGPGGIRPGGGLDGASSANNDLNFKTLTQGSQTTELIRGQISQLRTVPSPSVNESQNVAFRANLNPSATAQALIAKLVS